MKPHYTESDLLRIKHIVEEHFAEKPAKYDSEQAQQRHIEGTVKEIKETLKTEKPCLT